MNETITKKMNSNPSPTDSDIENMMNIYKNTQYKNY